MGMLMLFKPGNMQSFGHKKRSFRQILACASNQKNSFKTNVKVGVLRKEMPPKPLNMQSFGHQTFISSKPFLYL